MTFWQCFNLVAVPLCPFGRGRIFYHLVGPHGLNWFDRERFRPINYSSKTPLSMIAVSEFQDIPKSHLAGAPNPEIDRAFANVDSPKNQIAF